MQKVATANSALRSGIQASGFAFHTFRYAGPLWLDLIDTENITAHFK